MSYNIDKTLPPEADIPGLDQLTRPGNDDPTTAAELATFDSLLKLARLQRLKHLPDADFSRVVKFGYSGSAWGKMKAGNFNGSVSNAVSAVKRALALAQRNRVIEAEGSTIMFDHVLDAVASVQIAQANAARKDEHRITFVVGAAGSGKTGTLNYLHEKFDGDFLNAHPDWKKSYMSSLEEFAKGIGISSTYHRVHKLQDAVLEDLQGRARLVVIDEANYFGCEMLDFIKTICNETACTLALGTLPGDLRRLNATHNHEMRQVVRRCVAIVKIPQVDSAMVAAVHAARYSRLTLNGHAPAITNLANKYHRLDTVVRVFDEADPEDSQDIPNAIKRVERSITLEDVK